MQVCRTARNWGIRFALLALLGVSSLSAREAVLTSVYPSAAEIQRQTAIARRRGAVVYYGLTPEQVQELTQAAVAGALGPNSPKLSELAARIALPKGVALTLLRIIGRAHVTPDQLPQKLTEMADHFWRAHEQLIGFHPERRTAGRLVERARRTIAAGDFGKTHQLLAEARQELIKAAGQSDALHRRSMLLSAAWLSAAEGDLAKTELQYLQAADLFKEAANLTAGDSAPPLFSYLVAEAAALYLQGREFGDKASLFAAIELRKRLVEQGWVSHVDLGDALAALGEHETGTARLEEAVAQYRTALTGLTRPLETFLRARAQVKLGIALVELGVRGSGTVPLKDAVSAYREALIVLTQDEVPLEWARTQYNLGIALELTSEHESRTARLEEAVAAYRAALTEFDKERVPVEWAMTQNKLSAALDRLGKQSR